MNALLGQLLNNFLSGKFKNEMQTFNQMMSGKDVNQQIQTLLNMAKSRGFDINAKMFSAQDLKTLGLNPPSKGVD